MRLRGDLAEDRASAPVFRNELILGQLLLDSVNVSARLVDLIDCNDDFHVRSLCMVDRLDSLRHDTVICRNDQHGDIRGIRAAHTHSRKCLMTRCVEECDLLPVDRDHVSADMLRDTARLAVGHMCIPDRVKEGCLAVVNVTHDTDNRRTSDHIILRLFALCKKVADDVFLLLLLRDDVIVHGDLFSLIVSQLVVQRDHFSLHKEVFDKSCRLHLHCLREFADCQLLGDLDLGNDFLLLGLFISRLSMLKSLRDPVELFLILIRAGAELSMLAVLSALLAVAVIIFPAVFTVISRRLVSKRTVTRCRSGRTGCPASSCRRSLSEGRSSLRSLSESRTSLVLAIGGTCIASCAAKRSPAVASGPGISGPSVSPAGIARRSAVVSRSAVRSSAVTACPRIRLPHVAACAGIRRPAVVPCPAVGSSAVTACPRIRLSCVRPAGIARRPAVIPCPAIGRSAVAACPCIRLSRITACPRIRGSAVIPCSAIRRSAICPAGTCPCSVIVSAAGVGLSHITACTGIRRPVGPAARSSSVSPGSLCRSRSAIAAARISSVTAACRSLLAILSASCRCSLTGLSASCRCLFTGLSASCRCSLTGLSASCRCSLTGLSTSCRCFFFTTYGSCLRFCRTLMPGIPAFGRSRLRTSGCHIRGALHNLYRRGGRLNRCLRCLRGHFIFLICHRGSSGRLAVRINEIRPPGFLLHRSRRIVRAEHADNSLAFFRCLLPFRAACLRIRLLTGSCTALAASESGANVFDLAFRHCRDTCHSRVALGSQISDDLALIRAQLFCKLMNLDFCHSYLLLPRPSLS